MESLCKYMKTPYQIISTLNWLFQILNFKNFMYNLDATYNLVLLNFNFQTKPKGYLHYANRDSILIS